MGSPRRGARQLGLAVHAVIALAVAAGLVACASSSTGDSAGGAAITVVAAESFWGSIASQLGGARVSVTSIVSSPDVDPHDYEPRARDGRAVASAGYVIFNGAGYDPWAPKLVAAAGRRGQAVLDIGKLVGVKEGGNPHRWYSPPDVQKVIDQISADFRRIDAAGAGYYTEQERAFESSGLKRYHDSIAAIRQAYAGTPVGASESIFAPLAEALDLRLLTPESFLDAISEGAEPTARAKAAVDAQLKAQEVKVYVYNRQNATPDVKAQVNLARQQGIPVTSVTETPPANTSFQEWQADQLEQLEDALAKAKAA